MTKCQSHDHPQVPMTVTTLVICYCHACDAFVMHSGIHTQHDDERIDDREHDTVEYGPFDDVGLVLDDALMTINRLLASTGRPWDQRWDVPEGPDELPPAG